MSNQFDLSNSYKFGRNEPDADAENMISGAFFIGEGRVRIEMARPATGESVFVEQQYNFSGELDSQEGAPELGELAGAILQRIEAGEDLDDVIADDDIAHDVMITGARLLGIDYDPAGPVNIWTPGQGWRKAEKRLTAGWKRSLN